MTSVTSLEYTRVVTARALFESMIDSVAVVNTQMPTHDNYTSTLNVTARALFESMIDSVAVVNTANAHAR